MERHELRALMLAQVLSTHNIKRQILAGEMKEALARVDEMLAATCPSCDGTGTFDTGMDPVTKVQRPEDQIPCDHGNSDKKFGPGVRQELHKESDPAAIAAMAQAASADLLSELEKKLEEPCKACEGTGKNSKGNPCICQQGKRKEEPVQEVPKEQHAIYSTEEYVCEKCNNANLTVELVVNKTPQTAKYSCKDCGNSGDIVLETEDDYTDFVTSGKKIKAELPPPAKKTRAKKEAPPTPPTPPAPANDMPVVETAPSLLEQFKAPDVRPIVSAAPKLPPPTPAAVALATQAQAAEQRVTGSLEVNIAEPPPVGVAAARESLKGMFGMMEDAQIIKEWETMTSKVFDAKTMTLDTLRNELMDRMIGLY